MWTKVASHPHILSTFGQRELLSAPKGFSIVKCITGVN